MKKLTLHYNPQKRYKNGTPRFGSDKWCRQVVANPNLTNADYVRFAAELSRAGILEGLVIMQKLLKAKHNL